MNTLLEVKNLSTQFHTKKGELTAVNNISFSINKGEIVGIVGESGCGKSVTSLSLLHLLPENAHISGGDVLFKGNNITHISEQEMYKIRGNEIAMIFQDSLTSLNPALTIGYQMIETFRTHTKMTKREAYRRSVEMLTKVGISSPEKRMKNFPHQLSGGMRQRVMIAIALSCSPELLIADEPTTALDVTIQAQILALIKEMREMTNTAVMLITHDLGVMAEMADQILVMYAGEIVEVADADAIFETPLHPYTQGLLASIPHLNKSTDRLYSIEGTVPDLLHMSEACRFCSRCPAAMPICSTKAPELIQVENTGVRCWKYAEEEVETHEQ